MLERIKTIILFILVFNSLILSGLLIYYKPDSVNVSISEYLPRPRIGEIKELEELVDPKYVVYHLGNNNHSLVGQNYNSSKVLINDMVEWSFYDFEQIYEIDWLDLIEHKQGIEIVFSSYLSQSVISSIFKVLSTNIPLDQINRIWLIKEEEDKIKAYFLSDKADKVYLAQTSITADKLANLTLYANDQILYSYHPSYQKGYKTIKNFFYLPTESISLKKVTMSYNTVPVGDFITLLFIDPSLVRKVEMDNQANILYTDGNRSLQFFVKDYYISYFQPVSENIKETDTEKDLYSALRFINQHGGWDEKYSLATINESLGGNQTLIKFQQVFEGYPIFDSDNKYGSIQIQVSNGLITTFQRPLLLLDKYSELKIVKTITNEQILNQLKEKRIPEQEIKSVELGYIAKLKQNSIILEPYWKIETEHYGFYEIPAYESEGQ